jgi:urease
MFAPLVARTSVLFVSAASVAPGTGPVPSYGLRKRVEPVRGCRDISKRDMRFNDTMPRMRVDPETYVVEADGRVCAAEPAETLPLTQQWFVY